MNINKADLNELEFTELLSEIIPFVYSQKTADRLANLRPMPFDEAKKALKKTSEFLSSFESANAIPFNEYEGFTKNISPRATDSPLVIIDKFIFFYIFFA